MEPQLERPLLLGGSCYRFFRFLRRERKCSVQVDTLRRSLQNYNEAACLGRIKQGLMAISSGTNDRTGEEAKEE